VSFYDLSFLSRRPARVLHKLLVYLAIGVPFRAKKGIEISIAFLIHWDARVYDGWPVQSPHPGRDGAWWRTLPNMDMKSGQIGQEGALTICSASTYARVAVFKHDVYSMQQRGRHDCFGMDRIDGMAGCL